MSPSSAPHHPEPEHHHEVGSRQNAHEPHSAGHGGTRDYGHGHDHGHDHDHEHSDGLWGRVRHALAPHSHDTAESLDSALESSARGIRAVKISLVGLSVTAALQLAITMVSGSVALLADTVHNFSDAFTALPLWVAFLLGRRAATRRYTYGYGRAEDLAGLFVVAMIALSALVAGWEAIDRLLNPAPVTHLGWVALAGFLGFLGNEAVAVFRIREGRAIGSASLVADGHHARTDGLTSLAVLVGAAGVAIGWHWADPVVGLVITVMIVLVLRSAARDVFRRLMDGVEPEHVDTAEATLAALPGVHAVQQVRMRWIGHQIHAEAALEVDPALSLSAAHGLAHHAESRLMATVPRLTAATIHAYPLRAAPSPDGSR